MWQSFTHYHLDTSGAIETCLLLQKNFVFTIISLTLQDAPAVQTGHKLSHYTDDLSKLYSVVFNYWVYRVLHTITISKIVENSV